MENKEHISSLLFLSGLVLLVGWGVFWAGRDFTIFYHAACIILDPSVPNAIVYGFLGPDKYPIPEMAYSTNYAYSMAAAYILAPMALLPYYWAKMIFILMDFSAYLGAVAIILRRLGATGRWFIYPLESSILWFPFIFDILFGQLNSILLFLVVLAVCAANRNKVLLAGVILGLAALFKLFPVAIAMVLGLKNWRILAACIATIAISLLIPDSLLWFSSLSRISPSGDHALYSYLNDLGGYWFWLYSASIGAITAVAAWRVRQANYVYLAALAIPAAFLAAPIVEFYHWTMLIYPYFYLIANMAREKLLIITLSLSALMICCATSTIHINSVQYAGLLLLWMLALVQSNRLAHIQYTIDMTPVKIDNY